VNKVLTNTQKLHFVIEVLYLYHVLYKIESFIVN